MRKGKRAKEEVRIKKSLYLYIGIIVMLTLTIALTFIIYNNKLQKNLQSTLQATEITDLIPKLVPEDIAEASTQISKTIEEAEMQSIMQESNDIAKEEPKEANTNSEPIIDKIEEEPKEEIIPDPEFVMPVEGEIITEYAKDNLTFSETLQEWVTHLGIDIKADRTSVVKSAEDGKVIAIKNDPRYGLTVIIEHVNGYKTIYSNLLTTEFITEGEEVTREQSIGTVGNSAVFEIADEPHLHFEITKDDINVNPMLYIIP